MLLLLVYVRFDFALNVAKKTAVSVLNEDSIDNENHLYEIHADFAVSHFNFQICLGVAANVLPVLCQYKQCGDQETSLILYIHGATWFLLVAIHYFLYVEHQNSLLRGYFNFHLETRNLRHISLHINSAGISCLANLVWGVVKGLSPSEPGVLEVCQGKELQKGNQKSPVNSDFFQS